MESNFFHDLTADEAGFTGTLTAFCSPNEIAQRESSRQIDRFEMTRLSDPAAGNIAVDPSKMLKKYQRSSADKKYLPQDVRTLAICRLAMDYLWNTILDFDINPKPGFCAALNSCGYSDVYSFLRDRTRSVRVDVQLQTATASPTDLLACMSIYEESLRFELISMWLLWGEYDESSTSDNLTPLLDSNMCLSSISQICDPLCALYLKTEGTVSVEREAVMAEIWSYVLLLDLTSSRDAESFHSHLGKINRRLLTHESVRRSIAACTAFIDRQYGTFLELFTQYMERRDVLSCAALLPSVGVAQSRALWRLIRVNRPFAKTDDSHVPEPMKKSELESLGIRPEMLEYFGIVYDSGSQRAYLPPRKLTRPASWNLEGSGWTWPAHLKSNFNVRLGTGTEIPCRSTLYKLKEEKFHLRFTLTDSRKSLVLGRFEKHSTGISTAQSIQSASHAEPFGSSSYNTLSGFEIAPSGSSASDRIGSLKKSLLSKSLGKTEPDKAQPFVFGASTSSTGLFDAPVKSSLPAQPLFPQPETKPAVFPSSEKPELAGFFSNQGPISFGAPPPSSGPQTSLFSPPVKATPSPISEPLKFEQRSTFVFGAAPAENKQDKSEPNKATSGIEHKPALDQAGVDLSSKPTFVFGAGTAQPSAVPDKVAGLQDTGSVQAEKPAVNSSSDMEKSNSGTLAFSALHVSSETTVGLQSDTNGFSVKPLPTTVNAVKRSPKKFAPQASWYDKLPCSEDVMRSLRTEVLKSATKADNIKAHQPPKIAGQDIHSQVMNVMLLRSFSLKRAIQHRVKVWRESSLVSKKLRLCVRPFRLV